MKRLLLILCSLVFVGCNSPQTNHVSYYPSRQEEVDGHTYYWILQEYEQEPYLREYIEDMLLDGKITHAEYVEYMVIDNDVTKKLNKSKLLKLVKDKHE